MAGRPRKQSKALFDLDWAVHELEEQLFDAAPSGVFTFEITLKRLRGEPLDEKTELWNDARDGLGQCQTALERLYELLQQRIRKLPTYRPPPLAAAASSATAQPVPADVDGDKEGEQAADARATTNHPAAN